MQAAGQLFVSAFVFFHVDDVARAGLTCHINIMRGLDDRVFGRLVVMVGRSSDADIVGTYAVVVEERVGEDYTIGALK